MLDNLVLTSPWRSRHEPVGALCPFGEGDIGGPLAKLAKERVGVTIGSYPRFAEGRYTTEIVIRSRDEAMLDEAEDAVRL
ncbi:hypothetical protein [Fulvimarina sp. MAC3]|uniref:hypothetical protein n=1 Tax=Fulvimarina sp. MAC3 TaxID=3148887 RepID=UPI0031FCCD13